MFHSTSQGDIPSQLVLVTPPSQTLPIVLSIAKLHATLPLDYTDEDSLYTGYLRTAARMVESHAEHCLLTQSHRLDLQSLPVPEYGTTYSRVRLEKSPISAIEFVKYRRQSDNSLQTLNSTKYDLYSGSNPPMIWIDQQAMYDGGYGGGCANKLDNVQIQFTAGIDPPEDPTEPDINPLAKQAILWLFALMVQKKEPIHFWGNQAILDFPLGYQSTIAALSWRGI